jgi:hypothetical protein
LTFDYYSIYRFESKANANIKAYLFDHLEAIEISVAPIVAASVMSVEGQPEISLPATRFYGEKRAPTAKASVGIGESCTLHLPLLIYAVFRSFLKVVSANEG